MASIHDPSPPQQSSDSGPSAPLSHVDERGAARMVDISHKPETERVAVAEGVIRMRPETAALIEDNGLPKGDVLAAARIAGVMAAKKTSDLIPLCHPIPLSGVQMLITVDKSIPGVVVRGTVRTTGRTGVEMEALTAVTLSLLTVYDMVKAVDKTMTISDVTLLEKRGGSS